MLIIIFVVPLPNKNLNKMKKLTGNDIKVNLKFSKSSPDVSHFRVSDLLKMGDTIDFDVYLPSKNMNLQRNLVWTDLQKSEFILTILKENEVPKFCLILHKDEKARTKKYEVIDGKQRLTTIISFVNGEFPIKIKNENYFFENLSDDLQRFLLRFYIVGTVGYSYEDEPITDQQKIDWFEQINFLGTPQDVEHLNNLKK